MVAFLLSPEAGFVTGQVLPVDGGITAGEPGLASPTADEVAAAAAEHVPGRLLLVRPALPEGGRGRGRRGGQEVGPGGGRPYEGDSIEDDVLVNGRIREDGRVVSDAYLFQVKTPEESKAEWDIYKLKATVGPDQAWRSMAEGGCPLVRT